MLASNVGHAKGYVLLLSGKDIRNQLTKTETIYEIRDDFRVKGKLVVPANSTLLFRGGSIVGGEIEFNETELEGSVCFSSLSGISGTIKNEIVLTRWFGGIQDLFKLLNDLITNNDNNKIIISKSTYTVRTPLLIRRKTGLVLDFNGSTIIDETQGESKLLHRANPMVFIRASKNVVLENMCYSVSDKRSFGDIGTDIICVGALSADWDEDTYNIRLRNIEGEGDLIRASSKGKQIESGFIGVYGNAHDVDIEHISYSGNIGSLCNIEYGLAPDVSSNYKKKYDISLPDYYGLHPYNIRVSNITGRNSPNSSGYLRTSSCYNVVFENCYGYNVNRFLYLYNGDQSISRVHGAVIVRNCASYINNDYGNTSLYGAMIQNVYANPNSKVAHEGGIRHNLSYIIENCEFQGLRNKNGTGILITGNDGSIIIRNVTIKNFGSAMQAYSDDTQSIPCNLKIENCLFDSNNQGIALSGMNNTRVEGVKFYSKEKSQFNSQILLKAGSEKTVIDNCYFKLFSSAPYISIDKTAGNDIQIIDCQFDRSISKSVCDVAKKAAVISRSNK